MIWIRLSLQTFDTQRHRPAHDIECTIDSVFTYPPTPLYLYKYSDKIDPFVQAIASRSTHGSQSLQPQPYTAERLSCSICWLALSLAWFALSPPPFSRREAQPDLKSSGSLKVGRQGPSACMVALPWACLHLHVLSAYATVLPLASCDEAVSRRSKSDEDGLGERACLGGAALPVRTWSPVSHMVDMLSYGGWEDHSPKPCLGE